MGRRPAPLDPAASPIAAFASALRELRDDLGPTAPTVDDVSDRSGIPRSTLYAALQGKRLPTEVVVAALAESWGGDAATWARLRNEVDVAVAQPRAADAADAGTKIKNVASETSELALKPPPGVPSYSKGSDGLRELGAVVVALERGDWRSALLLLSETGIDAPGWVNVQHCLKLVAYSMRLQCGTADVMVATQYLDSAKRALTGAIGGQWRAGEPSRYDHRAHLVWRVARLIQREEADLATLRITYRDLPRGRAELIFAFVEHLTWVEFDPYTVRVHPNDRELLGLPDDDYERLRVGNRRDLVARATRLRNFADARSGSVSEKVWNRMGGYSRVREEALRVLAAEPLSRGRHDTPVRMGRRRAWEYAQVWFNDTQA